MPENNIEISAMKTQLFSNNPYIHLASVIPYEPRDSEKLLQPFGSHKSQPNVVRATFFVAENGQFKFVTVLYRIYGNEKVSSGETSAVFQEIKRQAHIRFYKRSKQKSITAAIRELDIYFP